MARTVGATHAGSAHDQRHAMKVNRNQRRRGTTFSTNSPLDPTISMTYDAHEGPSVEDQFDFSIYWFDYVGVAFRASKRLLAGRQTLATDAGPLRPAKAAIDARGKGHPAAK